MLKSFRMEIKHVRATPGKSNQLRNVNTLRWESRNITTQPGKFEDGKSEVIAFVVNASMNITINNFYIKAILQVLIYKALYDKSYLGSKTTMTSGEWTCLISFATAPLTCSERGGSEKF